MILLTALQFVSLSVIQKYVNYGSREVVSPAFCKERPCGWWRLRAASYSRPLRRERRQTADTVKVGVQMPHMTAVSQRDRSDYEIGGRNGRSTPGQIKPETGGLHNGLNTQVKPGERGEIVLEQGVISVSVRALEYFDNN